MRLFLRPLGPIQPGCGRQWLHRLFIYLFCLRRRTHSREHPTLPHSTPGQTRTSRSLEIAADCLTKSCTCGFHSPAFLSGKCVCPAHGTILRSHCHRSTLTLKCFGPSPSTPGYLYFFTAYANTDTRTNTTQTNRNRKRNTNTNMKCAPPVIISQKFDHPLLRLGRASSVCKYLHPLCPICRASSRVVAP